MTEINLKTGEIMIVEKTKLMGDGLPGKQIGWLYTGLGDTTNFKNGNYYIGFEAFTQILSYDDPLTMVAAVIDNKLNNEKIKKDNKYDLHLCNHSGKKITPSYTKVIDVSKGWGYLQVKLDTNVSTLGLHKFGVIENMCKSRIIGYKTNIYHIFVLYDEFNKLHQDFKMREIINYTNIKYSSKCVKDPILKKIPTTTSFFSQYQTYAFLAGFGITYIAKFLSNTFSKSY
jgi:hypothetical protein